MNINELFPSNFLKAADLDGQVRRVTIDRVEIAELGQGEQKPAVYFQNIPKGLIANKTNSMMLAANFGPETEGWRGKTIELYSEKVAYQGRIVDAIRVRTTPPPAIVATELQAPTEEKTAAEQVATEQNVNW
jgi:hypothetical protein